MRRLDLERQLHAADVALAGLQETRARESGVREGVHFRMLAASADPSGVGGVELWVHKAVPVEKFFVASASSSFTVVRFVAWALPLCVVVLHAPTGAAAPEEVEAWWANLRGEILKARGSSHVIVLADANAKLGSVCSPFVGDAHADEENLAGRCFHELLADISCFAPHDLLGGDFEGTCRRVAPPRVEKMAPARCCCPS